MNTLQETKGIVLAISSAAIFGLHPTMVYYLRSGGMGITPTLFISSIQGLTLYFIVLHITKNLHTLMITGEQLIKLSLCSLFMYSTLWTLFYSFTLIPTGLASVIHFTYPSLVTVLSILAKREKLNSSLLIALICTFSGVILVSNPSNTEWNFQGIFFAASSAVLFCSYIFMINDTCFKDLNHTTFVFYSTLIGASMLFLVIILETVFSVSPKNIWGGYSHRVLAGALAFGITQGLGVFGFAKAIKLIGGPVGGALAAFEPLVAVIFGAIIFAERMSLSSITGCIIILSSIVYLSISKVKTVV